MKWVIYLDKRPPSQLIVVFSIFIIRKSKQNIESNDYKCVLCVQLQIYFSILFLFIFLLYLNLDYLTSQSVFYPYILYLVDIVYDVYDVTLFGSFSIPPPATSLLWTRDVVNGRSNRYKVYFWDGRRVASTRQ